MLRRLPKLSSTTVFGGVLRIVPSASSWGHRSGVSATDWLLPDAPSSILNREMHLLSVLYDLVVHGFPPFLSIANPEPLQAFNIRICFFHNSFA